MTNRERVLASLSHQQPDMTPYCIGFTQKAHARMAEYYGDPGFASKLNNCFSMAPTEPEDWWKEVRPDLWEDGFGIQWDRSVDKDIGVVCNRVITPENLDDYEWPDTESPARYEGIRRMVAAKNGKFITANYSFTFFERAWTLAGMENLLAAMVCDLPFVEKLFGKILEYNLRVIEHCCAHDIDSMWFGDDWGCQRGLIMGPELWRDLIKPYVKEMYAAAHARGKYVIIHSCGKVQELFNDLIEIGVDVFNPFQPEVNEPCEMKRLYGDRLCFFGGISTQKTLPYGTVQEVKDEVRRLLDVVGKDGGYFAAPAHAIPGDAKPENIAAMIDVLNNQ